MSSFAAKVRNKDTGEIRGCFFFDDYYGRHKYGYHIQGTNDVLNEKQFEKEWERVD